MASVTVQRVQVSSDHATGWGYACQQLATQFAELMGLSLVSVITNSSSRYEADYCFNSDLRWQIRFYNSSSDMSFNLLRQDSSGNLISHSGNMSLLSMNYSSSATYYYSFYLITAGTLKLLKYVDADSSYYGPIIATMLNSYDGKIYPIVGYMSYDNKSPSIYLYSMLEDYKEFKLERMNTSDIDSIVYDGKYYLVPVKFGSTTYSVVGSPGNVNWYTLYARSLVGSLAGISNLIYGTYLSVGGTTVFVFSGDYLISL